MYVIGPFDGFVKSPACHNGSPVDGLYATKFPEQLRYVRPWQPKRLFWNRFSFGPSSVRKDAMRVGPLSSCSVICAG